MPSIGIAEGYRFSIWRGVGTLLIGGQLMLLSCSIPVSAGVALSR